MADNNWEIVHQRFATEAGVSRNSGALVHAQDTHALVFLDGATKRFYDSRDRLADQTGVYGSLLIGTPGISGVTPTGGSSGASSTLNKMLEGIKSYIDGAVNGTAGKLSKFSATHALVDSILSESGSKILFSGDSVANLYRASGGVIGSDGFLSATLGLSTPGQLIADKQCYLGNFTAFDNSAADAAYSVGMGGLLTKNNSNTRHFYGALISPVLNAGGSNANTTFDVFAINTTNASLTGLTVNLFRLAFGDSDRLLMGSDGTLTISKSGGQMFKVDALNEAIELGGYLYNKKSALESTGGSSPTMTNAPSLSSLNPYKWISFVTSDGSACVFPVWKLSS